MTITVTVLLNTITFSPFNKDWKIDKIFVCLKLYSRLY